jgi:hypothetical protein
LNRNDSALLFLLEDDLEVLYREGGFALNYCRGLLIILCWLALLAAIGLAAASFLSFPVASFFSAALLMIVMGSGIIAGAIEEGTVMGVSRETGQAAHPVADSLLLPMFKGMLGVIRLVESFSPVDSLSTGRSVTWESVAQAFGQIVLLLAGAFSLFGMVMFQRRELAAVQGTS